MKKNKLRNYINNYIKWIPSKNVIVLILFIPFLLLLTRQFELDNDFWFLINTGKYIIKNGIPHIEPFTIHSDLSFIAQQWLTDIIFYKIYSNFNIYGMYIFILISNIIILYLLYKIALLINNNKIKLSMITADAIDMMLIMTFLKTRPQVFDMILLLLEIYLLELYIAENNKKYLLGLPLISLLMINLHASVWPMIFVFLIPYYLVRINLKFTSKESYSIKPIIIITVIMFIMGFINPYGLDAMTYLFRSYGIDNIDNLVGEMRPLTINGGIIIYLYMFIIIMTYIINNKNINIRYTLLFLGTSFLALQHIKGALYFLISSILIINYNLKNIIPVEKLKFKENKYFNNIILCILCITIIVLFSNVKYIKEEDNRFYEVSKILKQEKAETSTIYTGYNAGPYIEYQGFKCYIDARAEVFLKANNMKDDIFSEYYDLYCGKINVKDFINKYKFDYMLIEKNEGAISTYIDDIEDYTQIYNKKGIKLYKRIKE